MLPSDSFQFVSYLEYYTGFATDFPVVFSAID